MDECYETYASALAGVGYNILPVGTVQASKAYQEAPTFRIPTTLSAKGLRPVNASKESVVADLARDLNVDRIILIRERTGPVQ